MPCSSRQAQGRSRAVVASLACALCAVLATGCKKDAPVAEPVTPPAVATPSEPVQAPAQVPAPVAAVVAQAAQASPEALQAGGHPLGAGNAADGVHVDLLERTDETFGYSVQMPRGVKELARDDLAQTYSLVLPDGVNELNVNLTHNGEATLEGAINTATLMGSKDIAERAELPGGGFLVVKAPQASVQEVWVFQKGKTTPVTAKCTGPSSHLDTLKTMCTSLRATK